MGRRITKEEALEMLDYWWEKYEDVPSDNHMIHTYLGGIGCDRHIESIEADICNPANQLYEETDSTAAALDHRLKIVSPGKRNPLFVETKKRDKCVWTQDNTDYDDWATSCAELFQFTDGGPKDNGFKYCPYCGMPLITGE